MSADPHRAPQPPSWGEPVWFNSSGRATVTPESVLGAQVSEVRAGPACGKRLHPRVLPLRAEQPEQAVPALAAERLPGVRPEVRALRPGGRGVAQGQGCGWARAGCREPGVLGLCPEWPARVGGQACPRRACRPWSQPPDDDAQGTVTTQTIREQSGGNSVPTQVFSDAEMCPSLFRFHMSCHELLSWSFLSPGANVKPFLAGGTSPCRGPRPPRWPLAPTAGCRLCPHPGCAPMALAQPSD